MASKNTSKSISSKSITSKIFNKSFTTEEIGIKDSNLVFVCQYLSDLVIAYIRKEAFVDGNMDELKLTNLFVKFGVCGIKNSDGETFEDGTVIKFEEETINILGTPVKCMSEELLNNIKSRTLKNYLLSVISELSELTQGEAQRLEFFRKSN